MLAQSVEYNDRDHPVVKNKMENLCAVPRGWEASLSLGNLATQEVRKIIESD